MRKSNILLIIKYLILLFLLNYEELESSLGKKDEFVHNKENKEIIDLISTIDVSGCPCGGFGFMKDEFQLILSNNKTNSSALENNWYHIILFKCNEKVMAIIKIGLINLIDWNLMFNI